MEYDYEALDELSTAFGLHLARYVLEPDGVEYFSYLSDSLEKLYEVDMELARRDNNLLWALGHPDDLPKIRQAITLSALELKPYEQHFRIITPKRRTKWIQGYGIPTKDKKGVITWNLHLKDVTSATRLLTSNNEDLYTEVDSITDSIDAYFIRMLASENAIYQPNFLFISMGIEKLLGKKKEWIVNNPKWLWTVIDPKDLIRAKVSFKKALSQKEPFDIEFRAKLPDQSIQWFRSSWHPKLLKGVGLVFDILIRNITEQKSVEEENSIMVSLFNAALNGTFDAFYLLDSFCNERGEVIDFTFNRVNDVACKQMQMSREQLVGKRINLLLPINIENGFFEQYKNVFLTGKTLRQRFKIPNGFEAPGWYEHQVVKTPHGVAIFNRDISDEVNSTIKIKSQHDQLQKTLNDLTQQKFALDQHSIVAITDLEGTITYANQRFCEVSGYKPHELVGQNHRIINSGYHTKDFFKELYRTITNGRVWHGEIRNVAKNGELYWVDTTIVPFTDPNTQTVTSYIAIRSEITQRKNFEAELINANLRFEVASKAVSDAIWDWDIDKDIIQYSDGYSNAFGYEKNHKGSFDRSIGKLHDNVREAVSSRLVEHLQNPKIFKWEEHYLMQKANGEYAHVHDRGRILRNDEGKAYRMIGAASDVTRRVERQNAVEKQNKLLHKIAWTHSHKTRVPVANILGLAELIRNSKSHEEVLKLAEMLMRSSKQLDAEIRNVALLTEQLSDGNSSLQKTGIP